MNDKVKPPPEIGPEPETDEQREARVELEFQKKVAKLTEHTRDNGVRLIALELDGLRLATIAQSKNLGKWLSLLGGGADQQVIDAQTVALKGENERLKAALEAAGGS